MDIRISKIPEELAVGLKQLLTELRALLKALFIVQQLRSYTVVSNKPFSLKRRERASPRNLIIDKPSCD